MLLLLYMEPREKLPKVKMSDEIQERANKILRNKCWYHTRDYQHRICNGKAIGYATGIKPKERNENRPKKVENGNRREHKPKAEMKELRQDVARAGNELYHRNQQREFTKKEKRVMIEFETKMIGKEATSKFLRILKEQWLDKLRYKKVQLEKYMKKRNWKKHHHVPARPKRIFLDSGSSGKAGRWNARDTEICWVLRRHLEAKQAKAK